jgi:hypothetical protein
MLLRQSKNSKGGITHILVPDETERGTIFHQIYDKEKVDTAVLERNIDHFLQAHGTPFTMSPLLTRSLEGNTLMYRPL